MKMDRQRRCHRIALLFAALIVFIALESLLFLFVDQPVSRTLHNLEEFYPQTSSFLHVYTELGLGALYLFPSGIAILLAGGWLWLRRPQGQLRIRLMAIAWSCGYIFTSVALSGILNRVLKCFLGRARPQLLDDGTYGFYGITSLQYKAAFNSMPSGHSTTAFAAAVALAVLFPRARVWLLLLATSIAMSRVLINAHYISDVLAGAALGTATALLLAMPFVWRRVFTASPSVPCPQPSAHHQAAGSPSSPPVPQTGE